MHTRKIFIILCSFITLYGNIYSRNNKNKHSESFFFIQLTDPQFGFFEKNEGIAPEIELYTSAVDHINRVKPDFIVMTGDFVNHKKSTEQITAFKEITAMLDPKIKIFLIPGNHDMGSNPKEEDIAFYKDNYGEDRFSFTHNKSLFIGINSVYIKAQTPEKEEEQYRWLEKELKSNKKVNNTILFVHHPFFLRQAGEEENYSNINTDIRKKYLSLLKKHKVKTVFAGHYHNNAYGKAGKLEMITTSAVGKPLGKAPSGMRVVWVYPDGIQHKYYSLEDFPEKITGPSEPPPTPPKKGLKEKNIRGKKR